jgi:hypothetical protein
LDADEAEARIDEAVAAMRRLKKAVKKGDWPTLRELLREMLSYLKLWFHHEPFGKRTHSRYARGLLYLREDAEITCTSVQREPSLCRKTTSGYFFVASIVNG